MLKRLWRHLFTTRWELQRDFPEGRLADIATAVQTAERERRGQIVVALEAALPMEAIYEKVTARDRARQLFGSLRVWDTRRNNGVLIYLLLADHAIEILADRNAAECVSQEDWSAVALDAARTCAAGQYSDAILQAVEKVRALLPPDLPGGEEGNEFPDRPLIL